MILFNDFEPFAKVVWGASDTETFTYIDSVKVSENGNIDDLVDLFEDYGNGNYELSFEF